MSRIKSVFGSYIVITILIIIITLITAIGIGFYLRSLSQSELSEHLYFNLHSSTLLITSIAVTVLIITFLILIIITLFQGYQRRYQNSLIQQNSVFEQLSDGLITLNEKSIMTMVNPAMTKIFGYSESELLDHSV